MNRATKLGCKGFLFRVIKDWPRDSIYGKAACESSFKEIWRSKKSWRYEIIFEEDDGSETILARSLPIYKEEDAREAAVSEIDKFHDILNPILERLG